MGKRARLLAPGHLPGPTVGFIAENRDGTIRFETASHDYTFPVSGIERIEISRRKLGTASFVAFGVAVGAGAIAIANTDFEEVPDCPGNVFLPADPACLETKDRAQGQNYLKAWPILAAVGAGVALAAVLQTETWETVPTGRLSFRVGPERRGGVVFAVSLAVR